MDLRRAGADQEIEIALVVVAPAPDAVAEEVASLRSLAGARLEPEPSQAIRDVYFDFADGALRRQRLALRVRVVDGSSLLALKGRERRGGGGVVERLEIEGPWSPSVVHRVLEVLGDQGQGLHGLWQSAAVDTADPVDAIRGLGLSVVQDRRTLRQRRRIVTADGEGSRIGELAIDRVDFRAAGSAVRVYEIEIEAAGEVGGAAVGTLADALLEAFASVLRRWPHSKLATGRALEALAARGELEGLLGADSTLRPAGFDRIHAYLAG